MKSCEEFVAPESDYFVYAQADWHRLCSCIRCNVVFFLTSRDIRYEEIRLTVFC